MQRSKRNIQNASGIIIGRERLHFFRSGQTATPNFNSNGNASFDITSLRRFDEKEFYVRMKDHLFTEDEINIIDTVSKKIPFTNDFQLLKNITLLFEEIESQTVLGLHYKKAQPGKLFVLRQIEKEVKIKPYDVCLWPLHLILEGISNKELKHNFLYCLQYAIGRQIHLSEFTEGDQDYDMIKDHWSQEDGWHPDADIPDDETTEQNNDDNEYSLRYLKAEYGKGSECYKLFGKLKGKGLRTYKNKEPKLQTAIEKKCNESYFTKSRNFSSNIDNICFDLCKQILALRDQKLDVDIFDQHDHEHLQQFENGVIYSSMMLQFCWKEDAVQKYWIENLDSMESNMTALGVYVELTENGPAEFSPEILAYANQLSTFYKTIDKLYNTILNARKKRHPKK